MKCQCLFYLYDSLDLASFTRLQRIYLIQYRASAFHALPKKMEEEHAAIFRREHNMLCEYYVKNNILCQKIDSTTG